MKSVFKIETGAAPWNMGSGRFVSGAHGGRYAKGARMDFLKARKAVLASLKAQGATVSEEFTMDGVLIITGTK